VRKKSSVRPIEYATAVFLMRFISSEVSGGMMMRYAIGSSTSR
jgi:hypothetical protein